MAKTTVSTQEVERRLTIDTISARYGSHTNKVRQSLERLSNSTQQINNMPLLKSTDLLLMTFPEHGGKIAVSVIDTITEIAMRVPSNGFSKPSHVTLTNFIETAKLFKDGNNRRQFIGRIGKMVTNTDKNNPSFDATQTGKENWDPLVRLTLDAACDVIRTYVEKGKERQAVEIAETLTKSSATLYKTHLLKDVVELHVFEKNVQSRGTELRTAVPTALRKTELDAPTS